jgi:hypothetical protein
MATALSAPLTPASPSTVTDVSLGYQQGSASSAGKIRCCEDTTDAPESARGTLLTLRSTPLDASDAELTAFREAMSSMEVGWGQTLESLAGFLSTAR